MNADGTDQTNLTRVGGHDLDPVWSPDGAKIAFRTDRNGDRQIYVMNADGTGQYNLTNNPADEYARGGRRTDGGSRSRPGATATLGRVAQRPADTRSPRRFIT